MTQSFYSCGKLLLSGEYAVLQGATALALPTRMGQSMTVEGSPAEGEASIEWNSYDIKGVCWFSASIALPHCYITDTSNSEIGIQLVRFLITARALNPDFIKAGSNYKVSTQLEFEREDGLGSSSTLTYNIAQWANVDAFKLHFNAFKGSGFDVAVAMHRMPLLYQVNHKSPTIETFRWDKPFNELLYFVHLNRKQNTRNAIAVMQDKPIFTQQQVEELTRVSKLLSHTKDYFEFCLLLEIADNEEGSALKIPTIKQQLFPDFNGTIKSLGAWGGDYILATGEQTQDYFNTKGYHRIVPFKDMIYIQE